MVATYPSYMNETPEVKQSFSAILSDTGDALRSVMRDPITRKPLLSSSTFMAVFASLKHYIQPILAIHGAQMLSGWRVATDQGWSFQYGVTLILCNHRSSGMTGSGIFSSGKVAVLRRK